MKTFGNALNKESKAEFRKYMLVFVNAFPTRPRMITGHFLTWDVRTGEEILRRLV